MSEHASASRIPTQLCFGAAVVFFRVRVRLSCDDMHLNELLTEARRQKQSISIMRRIGIRLCSNLASGHCGGSYRRFFDIRRLILPVECRNTHSKLAQYLLELRVFLKHVSRLHLIRKDGASRKILHLTEAAHEVLRTKWAAGLARVANIEKEPMRTGVLNLASPTTATLKRAARARHRLSPGQQHGKRWRSAIMSARWSRVARCEAADHALLRAAPRGKGTSQMARRNLASRPAQGLGA